MWEKYLESFKGYLLLERGLSENTFDAYIRDSKTLINFLKENYPEITPCQVEYEHIQKFITTIQSPTEDSEELILKISSLKRIISGIRAFFKYLIIENIIETDPTELLQLPSLDKTLPVVLSNEEIERMLKVIDCSTYRGNWIRLMIEILYGSGLRITELLNLKLYDIYPKEEVLNIIGKGDKQRLVPLNRHAFKLIKLFEENSRSKILPQKGNEAFLFLNQRGGHLSRIAAYQAIKQIAKKAGIEKNIHPHTLRHSFATEMILSGADIMAVKDMMGHSNVVSTQIYTHLNTQHLKETLLLYHPLYKKPPSGI
ncbi:MAG: tyrosine-type recombinase/integrase [Bacteroidales bacterium]|jgi:integrase/recombinase XerD|nr:tyrosine-type recombinase/integrase [Bacteroidales bacterium]